MTINKDKINQSLGVKDMKKLGQKTFNVIVSSLMMLALLPTNLTTINAADQNNLSAFVNPTANSLNGVLDYGVFANSYFNNSSDSEANVATDVFTTTGQDIGSTSNTGWSQKANNSYEYFGTSINPLSGLKLHSDSANPAVLFLNDSIKITYTYQDNNPSKSITGVTLSDGKTTKSFNNLAEMGLKAIYHISDTPYVINFQKAFASMKTYASAQYAKANTAGAVIQMTDSAITVTCPQGENIINLNYEDLKGKSLSFVGVDGSTNYSVIVNVKNLDGSDITFNKAVHINGHNYDAYGYESGSVMFNLGDSYKGIATFAGDANMGSVLAPSASVLVEVSHNGSIYANSVENRNCEIHQSRFNSPTVTIKLNKTVNGQPASKDQTYSFVLEESGITSNGEYDVANSKVQSTVTNSLGTISFAKSYKQTNTTLEVERHYYKVYEDQSSVSSTDTGDKSVYYVIADLNYSSRTAAVSYYSDSNFKNVISNPTFSNFTGKQETGSLSVSKEVKGTAGDTTKEFPFTVTLKDTTVNGTYGDLTFINGVASFTLKSGESKKSTGLPLTQYTVTESENTDYVVTSTGDTGTIQSNKTSEVNFINTKNKREAAGSATINVAKNLVGRAWAGDEFEFVLKDSTDNEIDSVTAKDGSILSFKALSYTLDDLDGASTKDFKYTIDETAGTNAGMSYAKSYGVTVSVKDNGDGSLGTTVKYSGETITEDGVTAAQITNTYSAKDTTAKLSGTKYLNGRDFKDGDTFTFEISNSKNVEQPLPSKTSVTIYPTSGNSMVFNFDAINYQFSDLEGQSSREFIYDITETAKIAGVTNDTAEHKATVTLKDNFDGTMSTSVTYDDEKVSALKFVNIYNAAGTFNLSATKSISGRDWNDDDSFTFNVVAEAGSPAVENSSATATKASPIASFGTISFTQAGTYKYDITEEIPDGATKTADGQYALKGVVYDSATHVVTITVVDNGDGTLTATSDAGTSLKVTNSYTDIKFNKYDSNNNQLSGAKLALYEAGSATALDTWTSSADAESLGDYLVRGHSYVIRELSAPAGYATFDDVKFTLNADGSVTGLESLTKDADGAYKLIDAVLDVRVQKVTTKGDKLTGAVLALLDANGKVVDQWTTDGTDHVVKGLVAGAKYSIHEVSAPRGYSVASDISFTVENNGKTQSFTMVDDVIETPYTPTTPTPDRPTTPTAPDRPTTPNTGDQTNLPMAVACMLFGTMAAMFVVFFKRKYSD